MFRPWKLTSGTVLRALSALACTVALAGAAQAAPWALTGALASHDPNIYRGGSTWWVTETTDNGGIGVKTSGDGRNWRQGAPIFSGGLAWWRGYNPGNKPAQVWAPSCGDSGSTGYCYYAVSSFGSQKSAIGLATSAGGMAAGRWVDQGPVITSAAGSNFNAIDPAFVRDAAGSPWLVYGSFWNGIHIVRVGANFKPTGGAVNIARDSGAGIENGFVVRRGSFYYLFASKGACCQGANSTYRIVVGRSSAITGPYVGRAGVSLMNSGGTVLASSGARYKGPGGQSLLSDGSVMAWHAYDASNGGNPVLFVGNVSWSADGWPGAVW